MQVALPLAVVYEIGGGTVSNFSVWRALVFEEDEWDSAAQNLSDVEGRAIKMVELAGIEPAASGGTHPTPRLVHVLTSVRLGGHKPNAVRDPSLPHLGLSCANASFTRGAKIESGASFKYSLYSFAISSSLPLPASASAAYRCEIA